MRVLTGRMMEEASLVDVDIPQVWQAVQRGDFNQVDDVYKQVKNEMTTVGHIVMRGTRTLIQKKN